MRSNWVEISRGALMHNLRAFRSRLVGDAQLCAVVKANAYGHGAVICARWLEQAGIGWFAVTSVEEGLELRHGGVKGRVLVLGGFDDSDASEMLRGHLTPTLWEPGQLRILRRALNARPEPGALPLRVHVKLDTGMARLGLAEEQVASFLHDLRAMSGLMLEGFCTHLSSAEGDPQITEAQIRRFEAAAEGCGAQLRHVVNGAALWRFPQWQLDLARVGLGLYGYSSVAAPGTLQPVLSWKSRVIALRSVASGAPIGYGGAYVARRPSRIATLAAGYADGYTRRLGSMAVADSGSAYVLIQGRRAGLAGTISMDLMSVDVTDIPAANIGDEAVLLGRQGPEQLGAEALARWAQTIPYETLCAISSRVPRREAP